MPKMLYVREKKIRDVVGRVALSSGDGAQGRNRIVFYVIELASVLE
jgi:hypothetical protein